MKFWVAQDDCGMVRMFTKKPKRMPLKYDNHLNVWAIEYTKGSGIMLNNDMNAERYIAEDGNVEKIYLADILGFKRKGRDKHGILHWEGIFMKEAREVELNFDLKIL